MTLHVFPGPSLCRRSLPFCVLTATRSTSFLTAALPSASSASSSPYSPPRTSTFAPAWACKAYPHPLCLCPPSPASWRSRRVSDAPPAAFQSAHTPSFPLKQPPPTNIIQKHLRKWPFCSKKLPSACQLSSLWCPYLVQKALPTASPHQTTTMWESCRPEQTSAANISSLSSTLVLVIVPVFWEEKGGRTDFFYFIVLYHGAFPRTYLFFYL